MTKPERCAGVALLAAAACLVVLAGTATCTRVSTAPSYDLRGSYFGSFAKDTEGEEEQPFTLPRRAPVAGPAEADPEKGTAVLCLCSSETLVAGDDAKAAPRFGVEGVLAFLQNDRIGQKYPIEGEIWCDAMASATGNARVHGASERLCHYSSASGASSLERDGFQIDLSVDVARGVRSNNGLAFFNLSTESEGSYTGHIGDKLAALDSICDDVACRNNADRFYEIPREGEPKPIEAEPETDFEEQQRPETEPLIQPLTEPEPEPAEVSEYAPYPSYPPFTAAEGQEGFGADGSRDRNRVGGRRCGGVAGTPDCGDQGYCEEEVSGNQCWWDCEPGFCSCNSGSCFDETSRCTVSATYPASENWQATCVYASDPQPSPSPASRERITSGRDGARPPNRVGNLSCGGEAGTPDCGEHGFCEEEVSRKQCFWDCEPGFCSCTAGSCFDETGRCTVSATYPASENWQATCS